MTAPSFRFLLTEPQWLLIQPLLDPPTSRGRPHADTRTILEAILWKLTTLNPWYDLPLSSPSWQTCYQHYHRWRRTGLWRSLIVTLMDDLITRGGFDLEKAFASRQLTIDRSPQGRFTFTYPPAFKGTWQLTTAMLLLILFSYGI